MTQRKSFTQFIAVLIVALFVSCSGNQKPQQETAAPQENVSQPVEINAEAKALLHTLNEMGDYVNSRNFPSLIKPSSVYDELAGNILIIDLRSNESFSNGHIESAVNVEFNKLPEYFSNDIKPFEYDKIILVCYAGQLSSYSTALLRLEGYGNVFAMRWGMSGWNKDFASKSWLNVTSSEYEDKLETADNEKATSHDFPTMNTGETSGEEILRKRIEALFKEDDSEALISASEVFEKPDGFYTINYERRDKYESGHIPGAIRYKPDGTLGIVSEMQTIPPGDDIVIYCTTGHNSGFVTAYLRLFGYNAKTIMYGNNAFMYNKMKAEENTLSWLPFSDAEIEDYPYVKN